MSEDGILLIITIAGTTLRPFTGHRHYEINFACITGLENDLPVSKRIIKVAGVVFVRRLYGGSNLISIRAFNYT